MDVLVKNLENVFTNGDFSDLVVACQERSWNVHKVVVCSQSSFFQNACKGNFRESKDNEICLPDDDAETVDTMLHYFYHFDYEDEREDGLAPLTLDLHVAEIAEKYFVSPLCQLAMEKFNKRAHKDWNSDAFSVVIEKLWGTESAANHVQTLKAILLGVVRSHQDVLFNAEAHASFRQAAMSAPAFLLDCMKGSAGSSDECSAAFVTKRNLSTFTWYQCSGFQCMKYGAIFGIPHTVPGHFRASCPLRCSKDEGLSSFWANLKTTL